MESFISLLWVLLKVGLIIGIAYFIFRMVLWFFLCYAKVYYTRESGERVLVGYLWRKNANQYTLYDGIPVLGASRIGCIKPVDNSIYLKTMNDQHNYVEILQGRFTDDGEVYDNTACVAVCKLSEEKKAMALSIDNKTEIAYATGSRRAGQELMIRAAAVGALWQSVEDNETDRPDVRVGFADLALPAALVFLLAYIPFSLAAHSFVLFPFLGQEVSYTLNMLVFYLCIVWILYGVKHAMTLRNRSLAFILGLIDRNVGVGTINTVIIVLSVAGVLSCTFITSYTMLPLFLVLAFSFILNLKCFDGLWKLNEPCSTWGRKWKRMAAGSTPSPVLPKGTSGKTWVERTFEWGPVLESRGIAHHQEQVTVRLYEEDFNDPDAAGSVRNRNPFWKGVESYEELVDFASQVLNGSDENAGKVEETALTQIVNSAYQICQRYNLADFELYSLVLSFCQTNIRYMLDEESEPVGRTKEYFRFPSETLYDGEGDCDCKSVLAYRIFDLLGVDVNFAVLKVGDSDCWNHAGIVLKKNQGAIVPLPPEFKEYASGKGVYCELTGEGYVPGELPKGIDTDSIMTFKKAAVV